MNWQKLRKNGSLSLISLLKRRETDGKINARKVVGGNKQRDYITKEDVSSPTVAAEAVMLTCVIDAVEGRDVTIINVPNAFVQTVVEDEKHSMWSFALENH